MPELVVRPQKIKVFGRPGGVQELIRELIRLTAVLTAGWRADRIAPFIGG